MRRRATTTLTGCFRSSWHSCHNDRFAAALADHAPVEASGRAEWTRRLRATWEAESAPGDCPGDIDLPAIMKWLRQRLPDDAILTNGVGAYATWSQRYFPHYRLRTQMGPISGSMGYGLPAAIAAKLARPMCRVIALAGDGCYQMSGEELATAVQYEAGVIVIVFNNNMWHHPHPRGKQARRPRQRHPAGQPGFLRPGQSLRRSRRASDAH